MEVENQERSNRRSQSVKTTELIGRRSFLLAVASAGGVIGFSGFLRARAFGEASAPYKLAPESVLPEDLRRAPDRVREAYRFAVANRGTLAYIPCYCGCGEEGHTSNASCYIKDSSVSGKLVFDRMSVS